MGEEAALLGQKARLAELCWLSWLLFPEPQTAPQTGLFAPETRGAFNVLITLEIPGEDRAGNLRGPIQFLQW